MPIAGRERGGVHEGAIEGGCDDAGTGARRSIGSRGNLGKRACGERRRHAAGRGDREERGEKEVEASLLQYVVKCVLEEMKEGPFMDLMEMLQMVHRER